MCRLATQTECKLNGCARGYLVVLGSMHIVSVRELLVVLVILLVVF